MPPQSRCASQTGLAFSLGHSPARAHGLWPAATQPYVALLCSFNGLYAGNPCKYRLLLIDRSWRDGRLSWPSWLTPIVESLPTEWSPVNRWSGAGQGKSARQRL